MRAPEFWRSPAGLRAHGLAPLAVLYASVAGARLARPAPRAELPTIVIGGLTLGGDGKTPTALALAELLLRQGERPAFLTRGYGRVRRQAADVGDEALLLAAVAPTFVGADRLAGARRARAEGASVLILDDGFHSRRLEPDLAILVVDAGYGAGNGFCPPAGPLRAPLAAQLARADVLLVVETPGCETLPDRVPHANGVETWRAKLQPPPGVAARFGGARVFAFAGIGRPEKFARSLASAGATVVGTRWFCDHHAFSRRELQELQAAARKSSARLVTTQKDAARLAQGFDAEVFPVALAFEEEAEVAARVSRALARARRKRAA